MSENENVEALKSIPDNVVDLTQYRLNREKPEMAKIIKKERLKKIVEASQKEVAQADTVDRENLDKWLEQKELEYEALSEANESMEAYLFSLGNTLDHMASRFTGTRYESAVMRFGDALDELEKDIKEIDKE